MFDFYFPLFVFDYHYDFENRGENLSDFLDSLKPPTDPPVSLSLFSGDIFIFDINCPLFVSISLFPFLVFFHFSAIYPYILYFIRKILHFFDDLNTIPI